VAGTIGAVGNNGKGVVGVAWKVQLMPLKFMGSDARGSYSDAIECLAYARRNGAKVVNLSWGGKSYSSSLQKAIRAARDEGIIIVAAAGNGAADTDATPFYPASYPLENIVAVTATTRCDAFASEYANYGGTSVDVAAPGSDIYSTYYTADDAYESLSGTSMAAPQISGMFALLRARFPGEDYQQQIQRVLATSDPLPSLAGKCVSGGRANLRKALGVPGTTNPTQLPWLAIQPNRPTRSLQLRLIGEPKGSYVIEASSTLRRWAPIFTNTASADGTLDVPDPASSNQEQRFYRAREVIVRSRESP
jgi:subtilisin family serine protease